MTTTTDHQPCQCGRPLRHHYAPADVPDWSEYFYIDERCVPEE